jgi:hypothetical protein
LEDGGPEGNRTTANEIGGHENARLFPARELAAGCPTEAALQEVELMSAKLLALAALVVYAWFMREALI